MAFLKTPLLTTHRIIVSGANIEEFKYRQAYGYQLFSDQQKTKGRGPKRKQTPEQEKENQQRSGYRAKNELRRLINANVREWADSSRVPFPPKFLTFTFAENLQDLIEANSHFRHFIKRFSYYLGFALKYTTVHEIQKRGAIHYHSVFYHLPFVPNDEIAKLWTHGFTKTRNIEQVANVGAYMAKYLTKDERTARKKGQKRYFSSKFLRRPLIVRNQNKADVMGLILESETPVYEKPSEREPGNICQYRVYDLSKRLKVREEVLGCL